jgi:hypothetical protein
VWSKVFGSLNESDVNFIKAMGGLSLYAASFSKSVGSNVRLADLISTLPNSSILSNPSAHHLSGFAVTLAPIP